MKHLFFNILLAGCCLSALVSCGDETDVLPNFANPEQEATEAYLYLKENGEQEVTVYADGEFTDYTFTVVRGGKQDLPASAKLAVMTQEEVDENYGSDGFDYVIIPDGSYKLPNQTEIIFSESEDVKDVTVSLNAKQMQEAVLMMMDEVEEEGNGEGSGSETEKVKRYVLPLKLMSETDSVSVEKDKLLLIMDISSPKVELIITESEIAVDVSETAEVSLFTQITGVDENTRTVSCKVDKNIDELVSAYNVENGTDYTALPTNAYQLNGGDEAVLTFGPGTLYLSLKIVFIEENIAPLTDYLLPVKLLRGEGIDVDESICYIKVSNYSSLQKINLVKDDNNDIRTEYGSKSSSSEWNQWSLIDGDLSTIWHSRYKTGSHEYICHEKYGHSIDFHVGKDGALTTVMFEYVLRGDYDNGHPLEFTIYTCDERLDSGEYDWTGDESDWKELKKFTVEEDRLPNEQGGTFRSEILTAGQPFKWLRFSVTKGSDGKQVKAMNHTEQGFFALAEICFWGK